MELKTRRVCFAGCTPSPNERWMKQIARNLTDTEDGFLLGKRYVLLDRDTKFCTAFRDFLKDAGAESLLLSANNLGAANKHYITRLATEEATLNGLDSSDRFDHLQDWLDTASANQLLIKERTKNDDINPQFAPADKWLEILEDFSE